MVQIKRKICKQVLMNTTQRKCIKYNQKSKTIEDQAKYWKLF